MGRELIEKAVPSLHQRRMARQFVRVDHPHLIRVAAVTDHSVLVERAAGGSLAAHLAHHGPLPVEGVATVGLAIARALTVLHRMEVVHGDVKPDNVVLDADGTVRLADLDGCSEADGAPLRRGTPGFLPDDPRAVPDTDLFSLGALCRTIAADPADLAELLDQLGGSDPTAPSSSPALPTAEEASYAFVALGAQARLSGVQVVAPSTRTLIPTEDLGPLPPVRQSDEVQWNRIAVGVLAVIIVAALLLGFGALS